jgi:hypothetical protein
MQREDCQAKALRPSFLVKLYREWAYMLFVTKRVNAAVVALYLQFSRELPGIIMSILTELLSRGIAQRLQDSAGMSARTGGNNCDTDPSISSLMNHLAIRRYVVGVTERVLQLPMDKVTWFPT